MEPEPVPEAILKAYKGIFSALEALSDADERISKNTDPEARRALIIERAQREMEHKEAILAYGQACRANPVR